MKDIRKGEKDMQVQKFENEKVVAYVHYNNLPTKENLEDACMNFLKKAMQDIERAKGNE